MSGGRVARAGAILSLGLACGSAASKLAAELLASLDGDPEEAVEAAWASEIETRIREVRRNGSQGRPWATVRDELRRKR